MVRQPANVMTATSDDVVGLALRFAGVIRQQFAAHMARERWAVEANLRRGCFGVLRVIEEADEAVSQREVSALIGIDASDVVDLVDRLEYAGFVRRRRDERDRRRNVLELTTEGGEAIERFLAVSRAVDEVVLEALDAQERATLRRLLVRVLDATQRPE